MKEAVKGRQWGWVFPLAVVGSAALAVAWLDAGSWWLRAYMIAAVVILALILLGGWAIVSLTPRWPWRIAGLVLWIGSLTLAGVFAKRFVRVVGASGSGLVELEWAWSDPDELTTLPAPEPPTGSAVGAALPTGGGRAEYTQFLGPARDGVIPGVELGRPDWGKNPPELVWEREIGLGWSGFVVSSGLAVTQEQRGDQELVSCYELATGDIVWTHANETRFSETLGGTGPRSNPTIDGDRVFALGATGTLDCLHLNSGQPLWSQQVFPANQNIEWGKSCSPLVTDGLVVVTGGKEPGPSLLAYSRDTGEPVWNAGKWASSYSSPVLATLAGQRQIVAVHADRVTGHSVGEGTVLWEFLWPGPYPRVAQPIIHGDDRILVSAGYGYGAVTFDVSPSPDPTAGLLFVTTEAWRSMRLKTKFSSALVRNGFAFGLDEGRLACINLADGSRSWRGEKLGYGQNLLVGDLLLVQAENGEVVLVKANPTEYQEITRFPALQAKTWNPPALAYPFLLVRNAEDAACYRLD